MNSVNSKSSPAPHPYVVVDTLSGVAKLACCMRNTSTVSSSVSGIASQYLYPQYVLYDPVTTLTPSVSIPSSSVIVPSQMQLQQSQIISNTSVTHSHVSQQTISSSPVTSDINKPAVKASGKRKYTRNHIVSGVAKKSKTAKSPVVNMTVVNQQDEINPNAERIDEIIASLKEFKCKPEEVVELRLELIRLNADRGRIKRCFRSMRNELRTLSNDVMSEFENNINKSSIRAKSYYGSRRVFKNNELSRLWDSVIAGTVPLTALLRLRKLLIEDIGSYGASCRMAEAKRLLKNRHICGGAAVIDAFDSMPPISRATRSSSRVLAFIHAMDKEKIPVTKFTSMYKTFSQQQRTSFMRKKVTLYIERLAKTFTSHSERIKLLRQLPKSLRKSTSVYMTLFPGESVCANRIRSGNCEVHEIPALLEKLKHIMSFNHLRCILRTYSYIRRPFNHDENEQFVQATNSLRLWFNNVNHDLSDSDTSDNEEGGRLLDMKVETLRQLEASAYSIFHQFNNLIGMNAGQLQSSCTSVQPDYESNTINTVSVDDLVDSGHTNSMTVENQSSVGLHHDQYSDIANMSHGHCPSSSNLMSYTSEADTQLQLENNLLIGEDQPSNEESMEAFDVEPWENFCDRLLCGGISENAASIVSISTASCSVVGPHGAPVPSTINEDCMQNTEFQMHIEEDAFLNQQIDLDVQPSNNLLSEIEFQYLLDDLYQ